jgi:hypothetical protein
MKVWVPVLMTFIVFILINVTGGYHEMTVRFAYTAKDNGTYPDQRRKPKVAGSTFSLAPRLLIWSHGRQKWMRQRRLPALAKLGTPIRQ